MLQRRGVSTVNRGAAFPDRAALRQFEPTNGERTGARRDHPDTGGAALMDWSDVGRKWSAIPTKLRYSNRKPRRFRAPAVGGCGRANASTRLPSWGDLVDRSAQPRVNTLRQVTMLGNGFPAHLWRRRRVRKRRPAPRLGDGEKIPFKNHPPLNPCSRRNRPRQANSILPETIDDFWTWAVRASNLAN